MNKEERHCMDETLKHVNRVRSLLIDVMSNITRRGIGHDKSKLEDPEFSTFVEYTPKLKEMEYGSDEYKKCLEGMKPALDHHYKNNDHHPESNLFGLDGMSLMALIEMLADWRAATERHKNGDIMESIEKNQERFGYSDDMKSILKTTVRELGW